MLLTPIAVYLLLVRGDSILMLRRYNTGFQDGSYSMIAGHVEAGEDLKTAMVREAKEEAGIDLSPGDLEVVGVVHSMTDREYVNFFLRASAWSGEVTNMEPDKCDDLRWFSIHDLPANTVPAVRFAVGNYRNGVWFGSMGWC